MTIYSKGSVKGTQSASIYTANVAQTWTETSSVTVEQSHTVGGSFSYQYASGTGATGKSPGRTLYRRSEEVRGVLKGSFAFDTKSVFETTPL